MTSTKESTEGPWKLLLEKTHHSDASQDEHKYGISVIHLPTGRTIKHLTGSDVVTKFGEFSSGYKMPELIRKKGKDGSETIQLKVLSCKTGEDEMFALKEPAGASS
ncbi:unnamed protein product [Durusdinium trenchii]|uniref:Uncharacterized protein n=1 Tax=Durusdinium trenchii TaxID=1381693 RepID=A0ABP0HG66_9DINO